jgi:ribonuclease VapC
MPRGLAPVIVDSSALIAILYAEDDAEKYALALASAEQRFISAGNCLETGIVIDHQRGAAAGRQFDALLVRANIVVEPVNREQADIARQAYLDFGKGRHPAGLNFGDCFSYALASYLGMPLLFKGDDFTLTDIASAI